MLPRDPEGYIILRKPPVTTPVDHLGEEATIIQRLVILQDTLGSYYLAFFDFLKDHIFFSVSIKSFGKHLLSPLLSGSLSAFVAYFNSRRK